ncbi:TIM barrel protein [Candidatus Saccharibacteria bacterium]|nr:TIM barrel protein [Candidatus Saccharibacteria bacterium]
MESTKIRIASYVSMPFWCVANSLPDPFGGPVMPAICSLNVAGILAKTAQDGLINMTSFHDDDLVPWDPNALEDDLDPGSKAYKKLREIKALLDKAGIKVNTATCSLHGHPMFRAGGLCNADANIRALAAAKVKRTLRIGAFFGAKYYTYWVARDGFEVPVVVKWDKVYEWLTEGLNLVTDYIEEMGFTNYKGATIEPKPNEPRGQMFIPTSGHAVGFINRLKRPDFWGVNPELLQHESMCLLNASMTVSYLCALGKLFFLHFGSQIKGQFDNDFPPLIGPEGLKETVHMFRTLGQMGWQGVVEFDCHMLRAEGDPENSDQSRYQFIVNSVNALKIALLLASRIEPPAENISQSAADLKSVMQMCGITQADLDEI